MIDWQVVELAAVDAGDSLGWNDLHAGLGSTIRHQTSSDRLRVSGRDRLGADGELAREALASGSEHAGSTPAQPTRL